MVSLVRRPLSILIPSRDPLRVAITHLSLNTSRVDFLHDAGEFRGGFEQPLPPGLVTARCLLLVVLSATALQRK
jgi:hypothetical protein